MAMNLSHKLIAAHLVNGELTPGTEIALRIDQTLTQDATGTLVMLELEAIGVERVRTELSVQYVDHNLLQIDFKNPDDHRFLRSACRRFGVWYSRPGNGVSHPLHQERFGIPGKTLLGSDSHTPAAGAIGMLAMGAGGIEVALAMAGEPYHLTMPKIWGVKLVGALPDWVSAKDVILELLRRHGVAGGRGRIVEFLGPGLEHLSTMDRHVVANMGTELGATTTVFPSDDEVRKFLRGQRREDEWEELLPDRGAGYDIEEEIDLGTLEPLIAMPSSPGNVVPVREVAGLPIGQSYIGSSANPGYRDFAIAAEIVQERRVHPDVSFDVNPTSRQILLNLVRDGHLTTLIQSGARIHQAGCNGCIGMGQAPSTEMLSLRTVPRNFPGRSGTPDDKVALVSPETATASALTGRVTDPRDLGMTFPRITERSDPIVHDEMFEPPLPPSEAAEAALIRGPNIVPLPDFEALPETLTVPVLLKVGNDISTDEIMPAGARVLPFRSNIPRIAEFCFEPVDPTYHDRAKQTDAHVVVAGENYGQGSSREHAALAPRYLGLRVVMAKSFARIHWQNLVNFGILPLTFVDDGTYDLLEVGRTIQLVNLREGLREGYHIMASTDSTGATFELAHALSERQVAIVLVGGILNWVRQRDR